MPYIARSSGLASRLLAKSLCLMTSLASFEVSCIFILKRAWIFEKSLADLSVIWPMVSSMFSWLVTTTHEAPSHTVFSSSATDCRFTIRLEFWAMNWPTSSTKKLRRNPGPCASMYPLTRWANEWMSGL